MNVRLTLGCVVCGLFLTVNMASAKGISAVQRGDNKLSCDKIASEIVKMEEIITSTEESIQNKQNTREGTNAVAQTGLLSTVPFMGAIMGGINRMTSSSESSDRTLNLQAKSRKQQVTIYFEQKRCSEKSYQKAKSKAADKLAQSESSGSDLFGGLFGSKKASKEKASKAIATTALNVRKGPSSSKAVIAKLEPGEEVNILSSQNGWLKISSASITGWVSEKYMRTVR